MPFLGAFLKDVNMFVRRSVPRFSKVLAPLLLNIGVIYSSFIEIILLPCTCVMSTGVLVICVKKIRTLEDLATGVKFSEHQQYSTQRSQQHHQMNESNNNTLTGKSSFFAIAK